MHTPLSYSRRFRFNAPSALFAFAVFAAWAFCLLTYPAHSFAQTLRTQPLSGPYGVGTATRALTDSSRLETISQIPDDYRNVMLRLWYPAEPAGDRVPYLNRGFALRAARLHLEGLGVEGELDTTLMAHGREKAPVAKQEAPFPLLVFSPGWGMPTAFYRYFIEDIVSHGYAVAAIDHPYFSGLSFGGESITPSVEIEILDDGSLVPQQEQPEGIRLPADFAETFLDSILLRDVRFVVEYLQNLGAEDEFYGRIEQVGFGIYGQSLGGIVALQAAKKLPGCKAALNMDGWSSDLDLPPGDPAVPLLFMMAGAEVLDPSEELPDSVYAFGPRYMASIDGVSHLGFVDLPYMSDRPFWASRNLGRADPNALRRTANAVSLAFFNRYVKEEGTGDLLRVATPDGPGALGRVSGESGRASGTGLVLEPAIRQRIVLPTALDWGATTGSVGGDAPVQSKGSETRPKASVSASAGNGGETAADSAADGPARMKPAAKMLEAPLRVRGRIADAKTGEALPAATVQVFGGSRPGGSIANEDGIYGVYLAEAPVRLRVSCIGYRSAERVVMAEGVLDFALEPVVLEMGTVEVSAVDPAVAIMRRVIENKARLRAFESYRAAAYERQHRRRDTDLVAVREHVQEVYWDLHKGLRTVLGAHRGTRGNAEAMDNIDRVLYKDFYHDSVMVQGAVLSLPTHPRALELYRFSLLGQRRVDDRKVFDLAFEPRSRVNLGFVGRLAVLDGEFALLEIDLRPSPSAMTDFYSAALLDVRFWFRQRFRPVAGGMWVPADLQYEVSAELLGMGVDIGTYKGTMQLTDYRVDAPVPDSVYAYPTPISQSITPALKDSLFAPYPMEAVLTEEELRLYGELGEEEPVEDMAAEAGRQASTAVKKGYGHDTGLRMSPQFRFNRVDATYLGFEIERPKSGGVSGRVNGGISTGSGRWAWGGGLGLELGDGGTLGLDYRHGSRTRFQAPHYSPSMNSATTLLGREDYFDYYWSEGGALRASHAFGALGLETAAALRGEKHTSLDKETGVDRRVYPASFLPGRRERIRSNPPIDEGHLRSAEFAASWGQRPKGNSGHWIKAAVERGWDALGGDFSFTRYDLEADWRLPTFFRFKKKSNTLDLKLRAGTSTGDLPLQRMGTLDTGLWFFAPFGAFRSLKGRPYEGEKYLGLFWEHDFGTAPFELAGLWGLARRQAALSLHGAWGRTWMSKEGLARAGYAPRFSDGFHREIGLSLSAFEALRLDAVRRLDRPGWHIGLRFSTGGRVE